MKFLKHIRSRSKLKNNGAEAQVYTHYAPPTLAGTRSAGLDVSATLPTAIVERIFCHVCPHTRDLTYESSEDSIMGDGCMLCDMRDLAQCALVCRRWAEVAQNLL